MTCEPIEGADLSEQLHEALGKIEGQIEELEIQTQNCERHGESSGRLRNFREN